MRSELDEVAAELEALDSYDEQEQKQCRLTATVHNPGPGAPVDGRAVLSQRLEDELGDVLFDALLLAKLCEARGLGVSLDAAAGRAVCSRQPNTAALKCLMSVRMQPTASQLF